MLNGQEDTLGVQKFKANDSSYLAEQGIDANFISIDKWDAEMSSLAAGGSATQGRPAGNVSDLVANYVPKYADEILPFDITVTFNN